MQQPAPANERLMLTRRMGGSAAIAAVAATAAIGAVSASAAEPAWAVKYAAAGEFTSEQIAEGRVPGWSVALPAQVDGELTIEGDANGGAIGHVLVGLPLGFTSPSVPRSLRVELEYQTWCAREDRSAAVECFLYTQSAWDRLADTPEGAAMLPEFEADRATTLGGPAADAATPDVMEWTAWDSGDVADRARLLGEGPLVLVIRMTGTHHGAEERARVRGVSVVASDTPTPPRLRERLYPLKTGRTLLSDAEIDRARHHVERFETAAAIRDEVIAAAAPWLERSDKQILRLIPPASVPRAFNVGTEGCPVHGKAVYEHGTYPWILNPDKPYQIECPVGHETYPSNDFQALVESDYQQGGEESAGAEGEYVDDGWGWVGPNGARYWLVGYAAHWHWHDHILPAVENLSKAYVLTGEAAYAHKTALILAAIADQYPAMDYATQSRYGRLLKGTYHGKILNLIWETNILREFAWAYDRVWETIDGDAALHDIRGQGGEQIRSHIEANLLEEAIEAVLDARIRGNFGMHQNALAAAAIVRQHGPVDQWIGRILTETGGPVALEGLDYALYNYIYRDGLPFETAPGYNRHWTDQIYAMAEVLRRGGVDLYALPKLKALATGALRIQVLGQFTPSVGDSGSVYGGLLTPRPNVYLAAARAYGDPIFVRWLEKIDAAGEGAFRSYESLFHEPIIPPGSEPAAENTLASTPETPETPGTPEAPGTTGTRLLDGYGMGILENAGRTVGASLYYGFRGGHGHRDTLGFELFANGHPMMPDLGYPDFMNAYVPGIYSWSKNTIAHNAVMVDRTQQTHRGPGTLTRFFAAGGVHALEVRADTTLYDQTDAYRRGLVLVETDPHQAYLIDVFHVRGGSEHHYSLHGPPGSPGTAELASGTWSEPAEGTLAGADVAVGELHDDPVRSAPGFSGSYVEYHGSGFSHFIHTQHLEAGQPVVRYAHIKDPDARLQIRVLPDEGHEVLVADAQVSPVTHKELVKFVIVRHSEGDSGGASGGDSGGGSGGEGLSSTFAAVCEPYSGEPAVQAAQRTTIAGGLVVEVDRGGERDVLLYRLEGEQPLRHAGITTDGDIAVITRTADGDIKRAVFTGGTTLRVGDHTFTHAPTLGQVVSLDPPTRTAVVRFEKPVDPATLVGQYPEFSHGDRLVRHLVVTARAVTEGVELTFDDDLLIGRGRVGELEPGRLRTPTNIHIFPGIYPGSRLVGEDFATYLPVARVAANVIELAAEATPTASQFPDADHNGHRDFWISSFGPGAAVRLPGVTAETAGR